MKSRRSILVGIIIFVVIGSAVFFYVGVRKVKSIDAEPSKDDLPENDSVTRFKNEGTTVDKGVMPEKSPKDGSVKIVEEFIKSNVKNPESIEFFEWSEIISEDGYWKVRCKYRGISSFNAEVTTNAWFYIQNNKVVYTKVISKI